MEKTVDAHLSDRQIPRNPILYRGWQIQTKLINGDIWLQFGNSPDKLMSLSYPVIEEGLSSALDRVRLLIDLSIKLNGRSATKQNLVC